jgi:cyclase
VLKKRIIPVQLLLKDRLVKTKSFNKFIDVGNPIRSSKIYNDSDADELIFLNIDRDERSIKPLIKVLEEVSKVCFMPLALGGGIKNIDDIKFLFRSGADKVIINSEIYENYNLVSEASNLFGKQSIVVSIDVKRNIESREYSLYSSCGREKKNISLTEHIKKCELSGAGEIFVNSIDNDGLMKGYDIDLIKSVAKNCNLPIIACGGAGNFNHMKEAFEKTNVAALACGSLFNFGDNNPIRAKSFLQNYNLNFKIVK